MKPVVKFTNVSKEFSLFKKKSDQLLEVLSFKKEKKSFAALSDISFEVYQGETIGIIGINGSGKSTLSNLLSQVTQPSSGKVEINGETTLVAISAGLNNSLSGLENIELKCLMHGMDKKQIEKITPDIIEFADIGDFINQPIKNYSSGMKSRLGFAISVHIDPDVLIIDEALSVGDSTFHQKCVDKFNEFKKRGKTIFFISHSLKEVKSISDRIIWMHFGQIEMFDEKEKTGREYSLFIRRFNKMSPKEKKDYKSSMLSTQTNIYKTGKRNFLNNIDGKNTTFYFQLTLLTLCVLFSALLMFVNNPVSALTDRIDFLNVKGKAEEHVVTDIEEPKGDSQQTKTWNKDGFIIGRNAPVYKDKATKDQYTTLEFSERVYVKRSINNLYTIELNEKEFYISGDYIDVNTLKKQSDMKIFDISTVFPEIFKQSYEYFFAFLNADYNEISSSLNGMSDEKVDADGKTTLVYESDKVSFLLNEENIADGIQVHDIDVSHPMIEEIKSESFIVSSDEQMYQMKLKDYLVTVDRKDATLTFELNK